MSNDRQLLGKKGEDLAAKHLAQNGYKLVTRNYRCTLGEIDIIAQDGENLVFIEVKTRSGHSFGSPAEAVTRHKQQQILRVAQYYLQEKRCTDVPCRFDVVAVVISKSCQNQIELIVNAFDHC